MTKSEERLQGKKATVPPTINHPSYYNRGIEAIEFIDSHALNFSLGNVVKYITRAGHKPGEEALDALYKALWYLQNEIARQEKLRNEPFQ